MFDNLQDSYSIFFYIFVFKQEESLKVYVYKKLSATLLLVIYHKLPFCNAPLLPLVYISTSCPAG